MDYPVLYNEFSVCAESNQKYHFAIVKIRIALLIAIAMLGAISWGQFASLGIIPPLVIAGSLSVMLVLTVIFENRKYEKTWHLSRAVAETIKRESWLYLMKAKPYDQTDGEEAKKGFMTFLKAIIKKGSLPCPDPTHNHEGSQITEAMNKQRGAEFEERRQFYIQFRINDQQTWYARKSKINSVKESRMNLLMWGLLVFGVALAFANVISNALSFDLPINGVGIATTTSAAVLSWIGARSYKELSQSYNIVAHELTLIEQTAKEVTTEDQLGQVVEEAEGVMSQEHNLWKIKHQIT